MFALDTTSRVVAADAIRLVANTAEDPLFVHADHLGTPRRMTDTARAVVWDHVTRPFGETVSLLGVFENNRRFPGQYFDSETDLHYNYFRDYDPALGRYVQSDPIGLDGGLNTYSYVESNPIGAIDPSGQLLFGDPIFDWIIDRIFDPEAVRAPPKVRGRWACNARCPVIPAVCPAPAYCEGVLFGYGEGPSMRDAIRAARIDANSKLSSLGPGCQIKHCTYACTSPTGEVVNP